MLQSNRQSVLRRGAAQKIIELYGLDAGWRAGMRGDHFLDQDDFQGCDTWKRVVSAIREIQQESPDSASLH
jgi:hypothetical protein